MQIKKILIYFLVLMLTLLIQNTNVKGDESETIKKLNEDVDYAASILREKSSVYTSTLYSALSTPVRVYGYLTGRFQDVTAFGSGYCNHTSMEEFIGLWVDGTIPNMGYKLLLNIERPKDESREIPNYWGTGRVFIDEFALNANLNFLKFSTGFLWENSYLIKNATLTDRPMLFEKDLYQSVDEDTKPKYDTAFLKGVVSRDQRWTNVPIMGGDFEFSILGRGVKIIMGKLNRFYDDYTPVYRYIADGAVKFGTLLSDLPIIEKWDLSAEAMNISNDYAEMIGLSADINKKKENNNAYVVDTNIKFFELFKLKLNYSYSTYSSYKVPYQIGKYFYGGITGDFIKPITGFNLPLNIDVFRIDPTYTALLSNVVDSKKRGTSDIEPSERFMTDICDPGLLQTNTQGLLIGTQFRVPNILINLKYGYREQLSPSTNEIVHAHFLNGNNLNMAMWWHLYYSSYGYPDAVRDKNWFDYNRTYADANGNTGVYRYLLTAGWRDNQEVILMSGPANSIKYLANFNTDLRFDISGFLNLPQSLYLQLYGEYYTLDDKQFYFTNFSPDEKSLFFTSINDFVLVYNIINPLNILLEYGIENWYSARSLGYKVDYNYNTIGFGFDWDVVKNMDVYFKTKYFTFNDNIKPQNDHSGYWIFTEVKNFF